MSGNIGNKEQLNYAHTVLSRRREEVRQLAEKRKKEVLLAVPELKTLEDQLALTGLKVARAMLSKENTKEKIEQIKKENISLQNDYYTLLVRAGYSKDYLEPQYFCSKCKDKGYLNDGKQCECLKNIIKQYSYNHLNEESPAEECTFYNFSLDYYSDEPNDKESSDRKQMSNIFSYVKSYALSFKHNSKSLLFQGATGIGKTHLSLAIANEVIKKGYNVIYGSAYNLMSKLEKERFGNGQEGDSMSAMLDCDLLILDDLGAEFNTQFTVAALYNVINSRMSTGKPVIINTNLSLNSLLERYNERIVSRIIGNYERLVFKGKDIRQLKKFQ